MPVSLLAPTAIVLSEGVVKLGGVCEGRGARSLLLNHVGSDRNVFKLYKVNKGCLAPRLLSLFSRNAVTRLALRRIRRILGLIVNEYFYSVGTVLDKFKKRTREKHCTIHLLLCQVDPYFPFFVVLKH